MHIMYLDQYAGGLPVSASSPIPMSTLAFLQTAPLYQAKFAADNGFTFPYLFDESQRVAKDYV